jgi:hypothetical protein
MTMRTRTTVTTVQYTIEARDGGFVGLPSDPTMGTVEGATREDVQQKVAAKMEELMRQQASPFLFGKTVTVDRTGHAAPGVDELSQDFSVERANALLTSSTQRMAKIFRFVIAAIILLGVWHYVLQR